MLQGRIEITGGSAFLKPDVSRAVVYLASHPALDQVPLDSKRPEIIQKNKTFVPDLLVVPRGTEVEFPNWDPFTHNVFSRSRAASFDLDRYPQDQSKRYKFNEVGVVQIFCNIHPQMKAVVLVVPNRFFARADAQGRFQLTDLPLGDFELVVWHERCEEQRQSVRMAAGRPTEISVTLRDGSSRGSDADARRRQTYDGVERGLGIKRERLNLPVVEESHPAPHR